MHQNNNVWLNDGISKLQHSNAVTVWILIFILLCKNNHIWFCVYIYLILLGTHRWETLWAEMLKCALKIYNTYARIMYNAYHTYHAYNMWYVELLSIFTCVAFEFRFVHSEWSLRLNSLESSSFPFYHVYLMNFFQLRELIN